jgi:hypothetical protein
MKRGLLVAAIHLAIVLSLAAKYSWDRERLPRAWARTLNFDPSMPLRGRYVSLSVLVPIEGRCETKWSCRARLLVLDGRLTGVAPDAKGISLFFNEQATEWVIAEPLAFFISEHAKDPTRLETGERLWVELSVPPRGAPRPLRLGVERNGALTPLELR